MKVYLDTSGYKRPFDDQTQPRIALETQAVVTLLAMAKEGEVSLIGSAVLDFENSRNPRSGRRQWTEQALRLCREAQLVTPAVQSRARSFEKHGVKPLDALHVASAEIAGAEYFVTCDDRLLRKSPGNLSFLNPVQLVLQLSQES